MHDVWQKSIKLSVVRNNELKQTLVLSMKRSRIYTTLVINANIANASPFSNFASKLIQKGKRTLFYTDHYIKNQSMKQLTTSTASVVKKYRVTRIERPCAHRTLLLAAHNWQKWRSRFLTCPCHTIYRVEAVDLKCSNYLSKLRFLSICENWGNFMKIWYFVANCFIKVRI